MPEDRIWAGSPSQVKNIMPFFFAALLAFGILFASFVIWLWPPGIGFLGVPVIYVLCRWLAVGCQQFELTSERLLTSRGFLSRTTDCLELYRVKDMRICQPFALRLFGLENIELMTSDLTSPRVIIDHIPSSLRLSDKIREHVEACRTAKGSREIEVE
ncbi:MAG TPA: PH domain-containing protein [Chthoniobacteraceae bacterium]|jgi:uncharacterized membrane protein YdbT with pleckstrin-like domain|nr:PH domain-containing protein [Chthoniobacteraceae bacterium]